MLFKGLNFSYIYICVCVSINYIAESSLIESRNVIAFSETLMPLKLVAEFLLVSVLP